MKQNWLQTLVICCAIVVAGFFVGNMHRTGKKYDRYIQVKGLSEREVKADLAVWPINVTLTGNDLKSLKHEIETQNEEVEKFFKEQGFNENELSKGSTNIRDTRAEFYGSANQGGGFRYIAKSEFTIRTGDIEKLQKALTESLELMSKGILLGSQNAWRPVEYAFTGLNDLKPPMIEEATKNAREVAEKFARDSNSKVGKIRIARQGIFSINDRDQNTPHVKVVRVVSTIDFQLED